MVNHYKVLNVSEDASPRVIRAAYVAAARRSHPDYFTGASADRREAAEQKMREINQAWSVLGDEHRRSRHDLGLAQGASGSEARRSRPAASPRPPAGPRLSTRADRRASLNQDSFDPRPVAPRLAAVAGHQDGRGLRMLPVGFIALGVFTMFTGAILRQTAVITVAVILFVVAAILFVAVPFVVMARSKEKL